MSQIVSLPEDFRLPPAARSPDADIAGDPFELLSVGAMVRRIADMAVDKASHLWAFLIHSLVGGAMVAFGVLLSLVVSTGVTTAGVASLLMGLAFGMSFALILVSGMSLITADMFAGLLAVPQRRMNVAAYGRIILIGLAGNTIGALVFVTICAAAGGPYLGGFAERAAAVGVQSAGVSAVMVCGDELMRHHHRQPRRRHYLRCRSVPACCVAAAAGTLRAGLAGQSLVVDLDQFAEPDPVVLRNRLDSLLSLAVCWPAASGALPNGEPDSG